MRYEFIRAEKVRFPVRLMCRLLEVSRSGFYAWLKRRDSLELNDRQLLQLIREIFAQSHETYGSPRIYRELRTRGVRCDNAVAESFFATLKLDLIFRRTFRTRREARQAIYRYIEVFYNRQRRHSYLGYLSPAEFEELANSAEAVA